MTSFPSVNMSLTSVYSTARMLQVHEPRPDALRPSPLTVRSFSFSAPVHKKAGKRARDTASSDSFPPGPAIAPSTATDELYDFSTLEAQILKAIERLTHKLSELRAGGRFNPSLLEEVRVTLDKGAGAGATVGELAQVIPRGRTITVIVGEEAHVRPVASAILASPHSLNPQGPGRDAPTTLTITVPPATGESRMRAVEEAGRVAEEAGMAIRAARGACHKKMQSLEKARKVRPDDVQRAHKRMEEVVKEGHDEAKRIAESAKKVLQSV